MKHNESFYRSNSYYHRTRLSVDIVLIVNSLLLFFGFIWVLRLTL